METAAASDELAKTRAALSEIRSNVVKLVRTYTESRCRYTMDHV